MDNEGVKSVKIFHNIQEESKASQLPINQLDTIKVRLGLSNGPYWTLKWTESRCETVHFATRNGRYCERVNIFRNQNIKWRTGYFRGPICS